MGVNKVAITTGGETWEVPLAAILCLAITAYVLLVIIALSIRQCLLKKGVCGGECQIHPCCNCSELGLRCAQSCDCCGPTPSCSTILDSCCPTDQDCYCLNEMDCSSCMDCSHYASCGGGWCEDSCSSCSWLSSSALCPTGPLCDCQSCSCTCTTPECSTINCLCCEITIKGRQQETR